MDSVPLLNIVKHPQSEGFTPSFSSEDLKKSSAITKIQQMYRGYAARLKLKQFQDKILHEIDKEGYGYKIYPNQTKEWGRVDQLGQFVPIYRMDSNGIVTFVTKCDKLITYSDKSSGKYRYEFLFGHEEKLILLEKKFDERGYKSHYVLSKNCIEEFLWNAATKTYTIPDGRAFKKALTHQGFKEKLPEFIKNALTLDDYGAPLLSVLSERATIKLIKSGIEGEYCFDSTCIKNLIIHAAGSKKYKIIEKLIEFLPDRFESIAEEVIERLIISGRPELNLLELLLKQGKRPDYFDLWLQIAKRTQLEEEFYRKFSALSSKEQKILYQAAFACNNPFLHEPADVPITPDQYSINLMWINKDKMRSGQEFLLGNGFTSEERRLDFQQRFVRPISKWALANPESTINIWIDSEMATSVAIERSSAALKEALEGQSSGKVQFRDVRTIETVKSHGEVFTERMPVYFRVDLLRAIAADHVLKNQENQFFVYGDIDMQPLSADELFDKKTLTFLDDFGFVMAKGGHLGFENGFQILNGNNLQFMDSHQKVIIDLSLEMAQERPDAIKEQQIYDTYPAMLTHFLHIDGRFGKLTSEEIGDGRFRNDRWKCDAHFTLPLGDRRMKLSEVMPQKPVRLPRSHF